MSTNEIGCGSSTCHGHGDYAVCGEYYYDSIYICPSCKLKQSNKERDTYRDLCAELKEVLRNHYWNDCTKHSKEIETLITKAETILGEKNGR